MAALGAIRVTQTTFLDGNEVDVTISSSSGVVLNEPVVLGAMTAPGTPQTSDWLCEARLTDACTHDIGVQPLPAGQYQVTLAVPAGSSNDFAGQITVTVPGLTIVNSLTTTGTVSSDHKTASFALAGANGAQRFAIFTLQQDAF